MNKKETAQILAIVRTAYPNVRIDNPAGTVQAWQMTLGEYSADSVMKAARLHMNTSKFFPTPADIREKIIRAELIYNESEIELKSIAPSNVKLIGTEIDYIAIDEQLENTCKFVGLGYQNEIEGE